MKTPREAATIRVVLADDHPTFRLGARVLLEREGDITVVGEGDDGAAALRLVERLAPDVLVLDCKLPDGSGVRVAAEIQRRALPTRVLALSAYEEKHYVRGMLAAGALGYLLKEEAPRAIVAAVRAVARGERWATAPLDLAPEAMEPIAAPLTPREREVLARLAAGASNYQIGHALGVGEKTIEKHVAALFAKLGAASRVELATLALRAGLIEDEA